MRRGIRFFAGLAVVVCMVMTSGNAMADETGPKFKLGVGIYGLIIDGETDTSGIEDDTFYGGALVGTACFTRHIALRGAFYSAEHEDHSELEVTGVDIQLLLGTNFYKGFNAFAGIGFFSETMKLSSDFGGFSVSAEEDFSGAQATFGIGYSWSKVALDYVVSIRDTSDYEDFIGEDLNAVSAGITLSYIF